jgi:hypothetical protein
MKTCKGLMGFLVLALLAGPASTSFARTSPPAPVGQHQLAPVGEHPKTETLARSYAAREAASAAKVEKFQGGGSGIYIGGSTVVIVLLVVILIILI